MNSDLQLLGVVHQVVPALGEVLCPLHPVDPLAPDLEPDPQDQSEVVGDLQPGRARPGHDETLQPVLCSAGHPAGGAAVTHQAAVRTDLRRERGGEEERRRG